MLKYANLDEIASKNNYTILSELFSYQELPDTNPLVISDQQGEIIFANKTFWVSFNLQYGNNISQLTFEPELGISLGVFSKSNLSNIRYDHLFASAAGFRYYLVEIERIFFNDDQYFIFTFRKNDPNKNLESKVTSLSRALEFSKAALITADNSGKITYATQTFEKILNRDIETIFGNTIPSVLYSHLPDGEFGKLLSAVSKKNGWKYRCAFLLDSGEMKNVELNLNIVCESGDEATTYILTSEDVETKTDLTAANLSIEQNNNGAVDLSAQKQIALLHEKENYLNQLRNSLLDNLSHEIRTPYTAISGYSEIIEEYVSSGDFESVKEVVYSVKEVLKRVLNVFSNTVELSQIESGELSLDMVSLNCNQVLRSVHNKMKKQIGQKQIEFILEEAQPELIINTDWVKLEKVITALVDNAIKFTDKGKISISSYADNKSVYISVKDTGIGIETGKLEKLLEPFVQAESGYTKNTQGAGLGLTVAYKLTNLMNGSFKIVSENKQGTEVIISFAAVN